MYASPSPPFPSPHYKDVFFFMFTLYYQTVPLCAEHVGKLMLLNSLPPTTKMCFLLCLLFTIKQYCYAHRSIEKTFFLVRGQDLKRTIVRQKSCRV